MKVNDALEPNGKSKSATLLEEWAVTKDEGKSLENPALAGMCKAKMTPKAIVNNLQML